MTTLGWDGFTFDVTAAFLQGDDLPADRRLFMRIPKNWPEAVLKWLRETLGPNVRGDVVRS
eukprot:14459236-Alexandrium_andersonii.AAC.1